VSRRLIGGLAITLVVALVAAYGVATAIVWNSLTTVRGDCPPDWAANDPTGFAVPGYDTFDTSPYLMPPPEEVAIPSREATIEASGWWLPAADPGAPAIVVVHGHNACKRDHAVLLPAGMLHRHGYSVLLIDLRDHGDSTLEDGRYAGGTEEYLDVLGAWDWLQRERGLPAERIGLVGISLGAATVLIATGEEPRVAAAWEDSSYANIGVAIRAELARNGYPAFLEAGGIAMARLLSGDDLASRSPLEAVRNLDGRPLFVTHGTADSRLSVAYARELIATAQADGSRVESWIVDGAEHTQAMFLHPTDYEARLVAFFESALGP
jgi:dipeptidyl aminopeptidase/acylaminoacyl peptidase